MASASVAPTLTDERTGERETKTKKALMFFSERLQAAGE